MNMRNKMIAWVAGVVTVVVVLIVVIVSLEPPGTRISRAQAFKAMALALTTKEDCEAGRRRGRLLIFPEKKEITGL